MCIIAVKPKHVKMFDEKTIDEMFRRNSDGAGLMYSDGHKVIGKKGFMKVEDLKEFLSTKDFTDYDLMLHFRIGTSGHNDQLNCHPYPVYEDNALEFKTEMAVAHNGILRNYNPPFGADYNDTQNFIKKVLSKLPDYFVDDKHYKLLVEELLNQGYTNRLCIMTPQQFYLWGEGWIEDDGRYYSNSSYKPYEPAVKSTFQWSSKWWEEGEDVDLFQNCLPTTNRKSDDFWLVEEEPDGTQDEEVRFTCEEEIDEFIKENELFQMEDDYYVDAYDNEYLFDRDRLSLDIYRYY